MSKRSKDESYVVGYGKPPEQTKFKKGASGNPKGDVPPLLSSTAIWSPIPQSKEIGREEAILGRTDHWFSA
jgi:hypothetical protein